MIRPEQETWLAHLDDTNHTDIVAYDPSVLNKFERIKEGIQSVLGTKREVVHRGATSLGISGQGELDIYILVKAEEFNFLLKQLEGLFGKPGSVYPLERARFVTVIDGTKAEVFIVGEESKSWTDGNRFENYLRKHPMALSKYAELKESGRGLSTRAYYRRKIEFINSILEKA